MKRVTLQLSLRSLSTRHTNTNSAHLARHHSNEILCASTLYFLSFFFFLSPPPSLPSYSSWFCLSVSLLLRLLIDSDTNYSSKCCRYCTHACIMVFTVSLSILIDLILSSNDNDHYHKSFIISLV